MDQPGTSDPAFELPEECLVCKRQAKCRNYGVSVRNLLFHFLSKGSVVSIIPLDVHSPRLHICPLQPSLSVVQKFSERLILGASVCLETVYWSLGLHSIPE